MLTASTEGFFMSKEPKDTEEQPKSSAAAENSSVTPREEDQTESSETMREAFMKAISGNPRFIPAKPSGKAFVIGGAKPPKQSQAAMSLSCVMAMDVYLRCGDNL
jgi:hypothetical protein